LWGVHDHILSPAVRRRFPLADVDRKDRCAILIEYDAVATNPQSIAVTAGKTFYIPMAADSVNYQTFGDLLPDIGRQVVEISSG
jgi:hypothetical protein